MSQNWTAEIRSEEGKGASRRLRKAGKVPAIIYGGDKAATSIAFDANFIAHVFENVDLFNTVVTVDVQGGDAEQVVVKDIQRHPATNDVAHMDLQRASDNKMITKKVPLNFNGKAAAPGVKMGGLMSFLQPTVEVRCLAKDLPASIEVDVSKMEAGTSMRLSELNMPEGVILTALTHGNTDYDQAVVNIGKPKRKG
ncbi:50S ribosomal protein L25/general stress protein Ctc [Thiomicrorhabdus xiamenensis]|uniref:Large ribosomal subunit protein bL25 n=1 Tax=Thiomicrorhabdus xiamenensis TaxID=2739063 RepID=A0A7D4NRV1_9GAMM|nr:50S ribosomal protein L25/general stress protein Ctc [Thiomicrorhabdus xiamenensis]QKI89930.1 50S ribosomal protein L25/general stress protein Ctc [Thiomicrorhabdus xiamenensis]